MGRSRVNFFEMSEEEKEKKEFCKRVFYKDFFNSFVILIFTIISYGISYLIGLKIYPSSEFWCGKNECSTADFIFNSFCLMFFLWLAMFVVLFFAAHIYDYFYERWYITKKECDEK